MFKGRTLLIVTKHGKEEVLAPLLESELGVRCVVSTGFDTDVLGTFTGEVEREGDAIEVVRRKCQEAMQMYNCDLAVASEGSFGSHPTIFFAPADDEFVMLIDATNQLEIVARELSIDTNFNGAFVSKQSELEDFLALACFPDHAVIVRKGPKNNDGIIKGITDRNQLMEISARYLKLYGSFYIETDMRAMNNPKRMGVIASAAKKLVAKVQCTCPQCSIPGFGIVEAKKGLPCGFCGCPTSSTISHIYHCSKCKYSMERLHPNGKKTEDPMYCDRCNP